MIICVAKEIAGEYKMEIDAIYLNRVCNSSGGNLETLDSLLFKFASKLKENDVVAIVGTGDSSKAALKLDEMCGYKLKKVICIDPSISEHSKTEKSEMCPQTFEDYVQLKRTQGFSPSQEIIRYSANNNIRVIGFHGCGCSENLSSKPLVMESVAECVSMYAKDIALFLKNNNYRIDKLVGEYITNNFVFVAEKDEGKR